MQRSYFLLIFMIFSFPAYTQTHETFSDSNFSSAPPWTGDSMYFKVTSELELQSNGPNVTSQLHLSTQNNRCRDTEWNFYVRLDLDVTSSNWAKIYLTSDRSDVKNTPKGYYVKFEGTSNSIDLYKQDSTTHTKLIAGKSGRAGKTSQNIFLIKVICDPQGKWYLFSDTTATGNRFEQEGTALDSTFRTSNYVGVFFAHTSTRRSHFYFDNLHIDRAPLSLLSVSALSSNRLELVFNRAPDPVTIHSPDHYQLSSSTLSIQSVITDPNNNCRIQLLLSNALVADLTYTLTLQGLLDAEHEAMGFLNFSNFRYRIPTNYGDVVMTELLPAPSPVIGLPEYEYVELFNRTNDTLDLSDFQVSDGSSNAVFPAFKLAPKTFVVLCAATAKVHFNGYSPLLGLQNFPSLNNSSDALVVRNHKGIVLHEVHYSDLWYGDLNKKEGGWSLEMIDVNNPCGEADNWTASTDPSGGTPGKLNSVDAHKPDLTAPQLVNVYISDSLHILLTLNEKPSMNDLLPQQFLLDKRSVENIIVSVSSPMQIELTVNEVFTKGETYRLEFSGIRDCNGNILSAQHHLLVMPQNAVEGNIVINELLFNPKPGGDDFVELYNASEKFIDLKGWQFARAENNKIGSIKVITDQSFILKPHEHIAFTKNPTVLLHHYPLGMAEKIFTSKDLPSYNDDSGTVYLFNNRSELMDHFHYSEDFHFALIDDPEGVSLERISPYESSNNPSNWHSASSQSGYATPGYKNSQTALRKDGSEVWLEPKIFTPDQNGDRDFTMIHYKFDTPGHMANITIFDSHGREMLRLVKNELLSTEGFYKWDGNNSENQKVRSGAYIVYFEMFDLKGEVKKYKEIVVVGWSN